MSSTCLFYTDIPLYSLICVCRRHPCFIFTLKSSAIHVHYPTMLPGPVQSYHTPIWCGTWEKLERNGVDKRENSWKSARLGSNHLKRGLDFFINNGDQPTKRWLWLDCITLILIYGWVPTKSGELLRSLWYLIWIEPIKKIGFSQQRNPYLNLWMSPY